MFQQNLRKLRALLRPVTDEITHILMHNFREVIIIIGALGLVSILIIIFSLSVQSTNKEKKEIAEIDLHKKTGKAISDMLISQDDFILPQPGNADVTMDYSDFAGGTQFLLPDKEIVVDNYEKLLNDTIEDDLKFSFEKRHEQKALKNNH